MEFLNEMLPGLLSAIIAVTLIYLVTRWLKIKEFSKSKLKQQLYQSGDTIVPRKRRYLDQTFIWISYFSIAHIISFMFATLLILTLDSEISIIYPFTFFLITSFSIFMLAVKNPKNKLIGGNNL